MHYSDRPEPGAERLAIDASPPASRPAMPAQRGAGRLAAAEPAAGPRYAAIEIQQPGQEEVLWNIEGQLSVAVTTTPPLVAGHALQIWLDGRLATTLAAGVTRTRLDEVYRGEHRLEAVVVTTDGTVVGRSATTTFYVRQTSIANPQNPLNPQPAPQAPGP